MSTSLRGFSATSFSVGPQGSTPAFTLTSLSCSRKTRAQARLLGSFPAEEVMAVAVLHLVEALALLE